MKKTLKKSKTQFELICEFAVSYDVIEDDKSWGVSISAAHLSCNKPIKATDLNIQLFDKDYSLLKEIDPVEYFGELSSVTFKRIPSYFKLAHYEKTGEDPAYLAIRLFDFDIVSTFQFLDFQMNTEEKQSSKLVGYYGEIPISDDPPPPPPPDKCCCVESFNAPTGDLATNVLQLPGGRVWLFPDPWIVRARFENSDSCKCKSCEYRQEIKGQITTAQPGFLPQPLQGLPPLDFQPAQPGGNPIPIYINKDNFQEDTVGDRLNPGTPKVAYGYKPTKNPGQENYRDDDCTYWALDVPQLKLRPNAMPRGTVITIDLTYKGYFKDVDCGGNKEEKTWKWVQNHTY